MSASSCRSKDSRRPMALCAACFLGAVILAEAVGPAKAESEGGGYPAEQYASLPAADRMRDPAQTGSLPRETTVSKPTSRFYTSVNLGNIVLRKGAPTTCVPTTLRDVIADISAKFGSVSVESTHRSAGRNRRAGGAGHSLHLACRAVDFRIHNRIRGVMAYLRSRPEVGGLKIYRNGIIHIDNGSRRSW